MVGLQHATLAEQAYEELKSRIVTGRLPPGQRLLADELASQLVISQTPIKEALAELQRDGLVEGASRRASTVRRFSHQDIAEIYEGRILIETHAVARALRARRVDDAFLGSLESIFAALVEHVQQRNPTDLATAIALDREFHEAIVGLGANRVLAGWHRILLRQTQTIHSYSLERYDQARSRDEHGAILAALRTRKVAASVRALRTHLEASQREMMSRPLGDLPPRP
jgi:DNA-binding GntR family transcriptional regulator